MRLRSNTTVREILTTGSLSALLDGRMAAAYLVLLLALSPPLGLLVLGLGAPGRRHRRWRAAATSA